MTVTEISIMLIGLVLYCIRFAHLAATLLVYQLNRENFLNDDSDLLQQT